MIISKILIGNATEAFVEGGFTNKLNIISSDDNNKGKTIVIQSILYCLGNNPTFPASFDYMNYYYILEFSIGTSVFLLSRKNSTFVLKEDASLMVFISVSEFKRYWDKKFYPLPKIIKQGVTRIVDPELFLQLFSVGQDKKDTFDIANKGYYRKDDFMEMLFSYFGLEAKQFNSDDIEEARKRISELTEEKNTLFEQNKILKSNSMTISMLSSTVDKMMLEEQISKVSKITEHITELKKSRNLALSRKAKNESVMKELYSLNRTIDRGEVHCMDCGSKHIGYSASSKEYTFDVSTTTIRQQILKAIEEKIADYSEEIEKITHEISCYQKELQLLLANKEVTLESLLALSNSCLDAGVADNRIQEIILEIQQLRMRIEASENQDAGARDKRSQLVRDILSVMNAVYKTIDQNGNLYFSDLFSRRDQVYSGSEATEFHLAKIYAFARVLRHPYPIIIDSFRAEDLSTQREKIVLGLYGQLDNQVILTTTLKEQEMGKYDSNIEINHIDFRSHEPSHILNKNDLSEFMYYADQLSLVI